MKSIQEIKALMKKMADLHRDPEADIDIEHDHVIADKLLCQLLIHKDFHEIVADYKAIRKWYA